MSQETSTQLGDEIPEPRKVRFFVQRGQDGPLVYLAWFEVRGRDFYWGPSRPVPDIPSTRFDGRQGILVVPDGIEELPRASFKVSRHASGALHTTADGSGNLREIDVFVAPVNEIGSPTVFAVLIDKAPIRHPEYNRSLTRGGSNAVVLRLTPETWAMRHCFEFFITPAGIFPAPDYVIECGGAPPAPPAPPDATQSLSVQEDVILCIREYTLQGDANHWNPTTGFWLSLEGS